MKAMPSSTLRKFAPSVSDERKLEVSVKDGVTVVKLLSWVEGLGWSCQKTLDLDPLLLDELHRSLAAARRRVRESDLGKSAGTVIEFPVLS